jgi:hypothetical protein
MPNIDLDRLFSLAEDFMENVARKSELTYATALLTRDGETFTAAAYDITSDRMCADVARLLAHVSEAQAVVVIVEAVLATVETPLGTTMAQVEQLLREGKIRRPTEMPLDQQRDMITMYGEDRSGRHVSRLYYIEGRPGARRFVPMEQTWSEARSPYDGLFEASMQDLASIAIALARANVPIEIHAGLDPDRNPDGSPKPWPR